MLGKFFDCFVAIIKNMDATSESPVSSASKCRLISSLSPMPASSSPAPSRPVPSFSFSIPSSTYSHYWHSPTPSARTPITPPALSLIRLLLPFRFRTRSSRRRRQHWQLTTNMHTPISNAVREETAQGNDADKGNVRAIVEGATTYRRQRQQARATEQDKQPRNAATQQRRSR